MYTIFPGLPQQKKTGCKDTKKNRLQKHQKKTGCKTSKEKKHQNSVNPFAPFARLDRYRPNTNGINKCEYFLYSLCVTKSIQMIYINHNIHQLSAHFHVMAFDIMHWVKNPVRRTSEHIYNKKYVTFVHIISAWTKIMPDTVIWVIWKLWIILMKKTYLSFIFRKK